MDRVKVKNDRVLCIGSVGKDIFFPTDEGVVSDAVPPLKTSRQWSFGYGAKYYVDDRFEAPGGCACNVSSGLARLGISTSVHGMVGDDSTATWIRNILDESGVDTQCLVTKQHSATDLTFAPIHTSTGERTLFINRDVGEHLMLTSEIFDDVTLLYVGSLVGEHTRDNIASIHQAVAQKKCDLVYNPSMRNMRSEPDMVYDLLCHTNILVVNALEAREVLKIIAKSVCTKIVHESQCAYNKEGSAERANRSVKAHKMLKNLDVCVPFDLLQHLLDVLPLGVTVVLTCGVEGAWAGKTDEPKEIMHVGTQEKEVIDATGAGDAFTSGFVSAYLNDLNIATCLLWGSANSHSVITHYGGHKGLLDYAALSEVTNNFTVKKMIAS